MRRESVRERKRRCQEREGDPARRGESEGGEMGDGETEMGRGGGGEGASWGEGERGARGSLARRRNCSLLGQGSTHFWGIWGVWGGESTFCKAAEWRSKKPVARHARETRYSANHTPSTIDRAPSPTPRNASKLRKNIEQGSYDVSPSNHDSVDPAPSSISPQALKLDLSHFNARYIRGAWNSIHRT